MLVNPYFAFLISLFAAYTQTPGYCHSKIRSLLHHIKINFIHIAIAHSNFIIVSRSYLVDSYCYDQDSHAIT